MAFIINESQQELIEKYQGHLESEKKLDLILKTIETDHKDKFWHKIYKKIFQCKICDAYERIKK